MASVAAVGCVVAAEPDSAMPILAPMAQVQSHPRGGDPVRGRDLLLNNGTAEAPMLSCGVPTGVVEIASWIGIDLLGDGPLLPERKRGMAAIPYDKGLAKRPSGVDVVATSCLMCHASKLGGSLVIGLGNPHIDFGAGDDGLLGLAPIALDALSLFLKPEEARELARYRRVMDAGKGIAWPDTRGVNPADLLFGVLAAHRDGATLRWLERPKPDARLDVDVLYTDVPAWWTMGRRDRMFYGGFGQGSHARIMMTASLMCLEDTAEAAAIDAYFGDIEAFIRSLAPPRYTDVARKPIDRERAERGRALYLTTCAGCHGDSQTGVPPTPSVPAGVVGTDPAYAVAASEQGDGLLAYYFEFFNESWLGSHGDAGVLVRSPTPVYAVPPLDGVWATAPYFHNASVPTLDAVLNPALRPRIFRRSFEPDEYDFERMGWPYTEVSSKGADRSIYDTTRFGYGNGGHTFAAGLSDGERRDLLEYLKTQ